MQIQLQKNLDSQHLWHPSILTNFAGKEQKLIKEQIFKERFLQVEGNPMPIMVLTQPEIVSSDVMGEIRMSDAEIAEIFQASQVARQNLTNEKMGRSVDLSSRHTIVQVNTFQQMPSWQRHMADILRKVKQAKLQNENRIRIQQQRLHEQEAQQRLLDSAEAQGSQTEQGIDEQGFGSPLQESFETEHSPQKAMIIEASQILQPVATESIPVPCHDDKAQNWIQDEVRHATPRSSCQDTANKAAPVNLLAGKFDSVASKLLHPRCYRSWPLVMASAWLTSPNFFVKFSRQIAKVYCRTPYLWCDNIFNKQIRRT